MDRIGGNPAAPTCTAVMAPGCRRRRDTAAVTPAMLLILFRLASPRQLAAPALKCRYHVEVTKATSFSAEFLTMARIASTSSTSRTLVRDMKGRSSPTYSEVQSFDEGSLLRWASKIFKAQENQRYAQEWDEALTALESHHVDGATLLKLTRSEFDSEWNLMNIGLPQGAAEVLTDHIRALKPQLRRLSSGASGCDSDTGSGTSGCDSAPSESSRSSPSQGQALQGCSESSTGTRGCESSSSSSGAKGCATSRSTGSGAQGCQSQSPKGCQSEHAAKGYHAHAKGCDSGLQGCHSGVCGCQEKSGLGDFLGLLLYLPFILLVTMQAVLAPALLASALLLPALLLVVAFVKGSFFVLLLAGFTAAVWTGVAVFYQRREEGASLLESSGVE